MESQGFSKGIIDFLYGEMTESEKKDFENRLATDVELRKELEDFQKIRHELGTLEDKEVMEPFSTWAQKSSGWFKGPKHRRMVLTPVTAIAASLILLMFVGYVTNFSVSINDQGFQLSFNSDNQHSTPYSFSEEDVKRMLTQEIENNNKMIFSALNENHNALNTRLVGLESNFKSVKSAENQPISGDDLNKFFVQVQDRNTQLLQDYLNQTSTQQQQYFKTMLTEFNDYLQEQRAQDLNVLQTDILELKYSQTQQKLETDQVLSGLISTVSQDKN